MLNRQDPLHNLTVRATSNYFLAVEPRFDTVTTLTLLGTSCLTVLPCIGRLCVYGRPYLRLFTIMRGFRLLRLVELAE